MHIHIHTYTHSYTDSGNISEETMERTEEAEDREESCERLSAGHDTAVTYINSQHLCVPMHRIKKSSNPSMEQGGVPDALHPGERK